MSYQILYDNPNEDLFQRLLKIRDIDQDLNSFINPSFSNSWIDPYLLNDFEKAVHRIHNAINNKEKIIIFGDYDVDWVTASYLLYTFFTKFLGYKNISIRLPNRLEDGYWIKDYHLDRIKELGTNLVITVDNWITSLKEAEYAKKIWLDLIITDHHKALNELPNAYAVVNPQISPEYWFKHIAWVGVAFKIITAFMNKYIKSDKKKKQILAYLMPIVAIWTVSDCVPLVYENRLFTKMWIDYINKWKWIPNSLKNLLNYLNLKQEIQAFHIWFVIWPRLNAWWRIQSPYDSLNCLLCSWEKQTKHLDTLEKLNTERREIQENNLKEIEKNIDTEEKVLIAESSSLHEWTVGIVAGRITEKHNKPSVVITIKEQENKAVASLRGPDYFSVIDMLNQAWDYMERYWWHKQAWGMTVSLDNLEKVKQIFKEYARNTINDEDIKKTQKVDTILYSNELKNNKLKEIQKLAPFGEGNPEPVFLLDDIVFEKTEKVWKNWKSHLKIYAKKEDIRFPVLFWWKGETNWFDLNKPWKLIWKIKKDNYKWDFFVDGNDIVSE